MSLYTKYVNWRLSKINSDIKKYESKTYRSVKRTAGSKFPGGLSRTGLIREFDHSELRHNVRDAMFDSTQGRGMATRFADSMIDTGLKAKFEPIVSTLKISEEQAELWSRDVSTSFNTWLSSKDCSLDGMNTGYQIQRMYAYMQQRDNDMFVRFHYSTDKSLISPLQLQFIDPDQITGEEYTYTEGVSNTTKGSRDGIKYNKKGQEVSYNVVFYEKNRLKSVTVPKKAKKANRIYMIHGFRGEYAGQKRGFPLYSHLLQEMEDITTLQQAHIQKAINQSSFGFYTKPSKDAPASGGVSDYANDSVAAVEDFLGAKEIDDMSSEEQEAFVANIMPEFAVRTPGSLWNTTLNSGEDMKAVEQTAPADKFAEFLDSMVSYMSSSSGMPIEALRMKFNQNYSASRATLLLFWRVIQMWRKEMEQDFLNVVASMWLSEEIAAGRVKAPGYTDARLKAAWLNVRWIGSGVPEMDPRKEAEASKIRVDMGHETLADGALRYNGSDAEINRARLKKEIGELPISTWSSNYGQSVVNGESKG